MADIKVYTTPTCGYCKMTKEWLQEHGYDYEELDITKDVNVLREWRAISGGVGAPVIAHGNDLIIGFNEARLEQLLDCCRHTNAYQAERQEGGEE